MAWYGLICTSEMPFTKDANPLNGLELVVSWTLLSTSSAAFTCFVSCFVTFTSTAFPDERATQFGSLSMLICATNTTQAAARIMSEAMVGERRRALRSRGRRSAWTSGVRVFMMMSRWLFVS